MRRARRVRFPDVGHRTKSEEPESLRSLRLEPCVARGLPGALAESSPARLPPPGPAGRARPLGQGARPASAPPAPGAAGWRPESAHDSDVPGPRSQRRRPGRGRAVLPGRRTGSLVISSAFRCCWRLGWRACPPTCASASWWPSPRGPGLSRSPCGRTHLTQHMASAVRGRSRAGSPAPPVSVPAVNSKWQCKQSCKGTARGRVLTPVLQLFAVGLVWNWTPKSRFLRV